ncbi:MAG: hypothetical protein ACKVRO_06020 [Micropepsaceae bacterium]
MADVWSVISVILVLALFAGGVLAITWFSVARTVWLYKHPAWSFEAAFNAVYLRGMIGLGITFTTLAAIWFAAPLIPFPATQDEFKIIQIVATLAVIIAANLHYYGVVIAKIRRPPV